MQSATILVVDDEAPIVELIASYLRSEGFSVHSANNGQQAIEQVRALRPDLVVLDVMLPGIDGVELCRRIQQEFDVYILMLTARAEEIDKIVGLSVGADDYMTKPFSPRELVMRVKAILRRSRSQTPSQPQRAANSRPALRYDDLKINPETHEVLAGSLLVDLTPREFDLLYALAEQPGRVFNRDQLLERVWGHDFAGVDRVVDVHIGLLRRKLEPDNDPPELIVTVRGVGYKFVARRR
ncbi:MAG: response regulator transcription factor [Roseiflexaceae bacterium]|nr:response regulator transcription factor [Roseiflexaceae bacterium]